MTFDLKVKIYKRAKNAMNEASSLVRIGADVISLEKRYDLWVLAWYWEAYYWKWKGPYDPRIERQHKRYVGRALPLLSRWDMYEVCPWCSKDHEFGSDIQQYHEKLAREADEKLSEVVTQ